MSGFLRYLCSLPTLVGSVLKPANPALWGTLLQRLYDGAATPIEQTSEITGSPMTVVNDLANTGDRRELRAGRVHTTDGSADHCTLPSAVLSAISGQGSVTLSIKHISGDSAIELRGAGSKSVVFRNGWIGANTVMYYVHDGVTSAQYEYNKGSSLDGDKITVIHANGTPVLYINGTSVSWTASPAGMPAALPTSLTSGKIGADGGAFYVAGSYREVGIWSSDLSESDIAALPDTIPTTNCEAWYWCEEESGSVLFDSVSGNHGTITGTLGDIHQPDTGVTYSAANSLGHSAATLKATADTVPMCHLAEEVPFNVGHTIALDLFTDSISNIILSASNGVYNFYKNGGNVKWSISNNIGTDASVNVYKTWQRYAIRRNATDNSFTVYLNGVDITDVGQIAVSAGSVLYNLGGYTNTPVQFTGQMRRVRRWTSELSDADMVQASTFGGSVSATPANEWPLGGRTDDLYGGVPVVYSSDASTSIIPRDESDPTKDVIGDTLQYSGSAPRYAQAIQSGALQGDGASDRVTMPIGVANALKGATTATAVMWFNRPSSNAECFLTLGNLGYRFSLMVYTGNVIYAVVEAGGSFSYGSVANADTDSWHCAVLRFRGGETGNANRCQLWIDGVNQTLSFSGTIPAALENSAQLHTGRYLLAEWNGNPGNGLQGLSALYSDAWTEQEIADHYSTLAMPTDNAVAIYPCSEVNTAEGTVYDVSGNERHGTISGTVADVRAGRQDVIAWNQLHGFSLDGSTYVPGFNGLQPDGSTPTTYAPGATADKFTPDSSQIDRTGGVSHPDANVNSWDTSFESGDTQSNPEFVRNAAAGDDRFLAYQDTLTGDDLTSAQDYTT